MNSQISMDDLSDAAKHKFQALRILKLSDELHDLDIERLEKSFIRLQCDSLIISSLNKTLYKALNKRILHSPIDVFVNDCSSEDLREIFNHFHKEILIKHVVVNKDFTSVAHALDFADEVEGRKKKLKAIYCKVAASIYDVNLSKMKVRFSEFALHVYILCRGKDPTVLRRVTNNRSHYTKVQLYYHETVSSGFLQVS